MDYPKCIISNGKEESISMQRFNYFHTCVVGPMVVVVVRCCTVVSCGETVVVTWVSSDETTVVSCDGDCVVVLVSPCETTVVSCGETVVVTWVSPDETTVVSCCEADVVALVASVRAAVCEDGVVVTIVSVKKIAFVVAASVVLANVVILPLPPS